MCREVVRPGLSARGTRIKASVQQFGITCASDVRTRTGARGEAHAQKIRTGYELFFTYLFRSPRFRSRHAHADQHGPGVSFALVRTRCWPNSVGHWS